MIFNITDIIFEIGVDFDFNNIIIYESPYFPTFYFLIIIRVFILMIFYFFYSWLAFEIVKGLCVHIKEWIVFYYWLLFFLCCIFVDWFFDFILTCSFFLLFLWFLLFQFWLWLNLCLVVGRLASLFFIILFNFLLQHLLVFLNKVFCCRRSDNVKFVLRLYSLFILIYRFQLDFVLRWRLNIFILLRTLIYELLFF